MSEEAAREEVPEPTECAPAPPVEPPKIVQLQVSAVAKLNSPHFQNAVHAQQELAINNETPVTLSELTLTVTVEPAILRAETWTLDAVGAGETYHLSALDVQLDGPLLSRLTDGKPATPGFKLRSLTAPDLLIAHQDCVNEPKTRPSCSPSPRPKTDAQGLGKYLPDLRQTWTHGRYTHHGKHTWRLALRSFCKPTGLRARSLFSSSSASRKLMVHAQFLESKK